MIKQFYFFQTGLTGSTGYDLSFNPVHPVILSRINKPQINADERRLIAPVHRKGREERKAKHHKSYIDKIFRPGTRIKRIYTDNPIRAYKDSAWNGWGRRQTIGELLSF